MFDDWAQDPSRMPLVMGILNATPDSFSDGGRWSDAGAAAAHADEMIAGGASWIDVGGESTRPGSLPVPAGEQICRVIPILRNIRASQPGIILSIDTTRADVAAAALDAGANAVNDISAGRDDPAMIALVAARGVPVILMHMRGTPATMQLDPVYNDVTAEVCAFLTERRDAFVIGGVQRHRILLDPGIGFGKTVDHNLTLLRDLPRLVALGSPVVVGTSRKGFIGRVTGESNPQHRPIGTAATICWCVANGADVVRVHDVWCATAAVKMTHAMMSGRQMGDEK